MKNGISRRDFLKGTAAGAVSLAAVGIPQAVAPVPFLRVADQQLCVVAIPDLLRLLLQRLLLLWAV